MYMYCANMLAYERGPRGEKVVSHPVCDYCEVLCEILIFGYHISLISYFLDGVHGLEHNNFFLENCHKAVFIAIISFVFLAKGYYY